MTEPAVASSDASNISIDIACADRSHPASSVQLRVCFFACLLVYVFA
jgi:hypothetical protein